MTLIQVAILRTMRAADAPAILSAKELAQATGFDETEVKRALADVTGALVQWASAPRGPSGYMLTLRGAEEPL